MRRHERLKQAAVSPDAQMEKFVSNHEILKVSRSLREI
jgi:hypothetical protein